MTTQLPQWLVDLVKSVYVEGLNHPYFEKDINNSEVQYLVSLLLAVREEAKPKPGNAAELTESTLRHAKREEFLEKAKQFLEELEKTQAVQG